MAFKRRLVVEGPAVQYHRCRQRDNMYRSFPTATLLQCNLTIDRYKPSAQGTPGAPGEDPTTDYMNVLGMIFSMCGLMMRLKWCAWVALYCSCISFANSRVNDDTKQMLSSFMLSISAVVMSYLQNPQPMTPPWSNI
nr:PAT complex subunit Asterix-like [Procambarus clarkii]